mgnify:CR=1 FL=1
MKFNYKNEKEFKELRKPIFKFSLTDREYSVIKNALETMGIKWKLPEHLCDDCHNDLVSVMEIMDTCIPSDSSDFKRSEHPWLSFPMCDKDCVSSGIADDNTCLLDEDDQSTLKLLGFLSEQPMDRFDPS